jgi:hypothetical protein
LAELPPSTARPNALPCKCAGLTGFGGISKSYKLLIIMALAPIKTMKPCSSEEIDIGWSLEAIDYFSIYHR